MRKGFIQPINYIKSCPPPLLTDFEVCHYAQFILNYNIFAKKHQLYTHRISVGRHNSFLAQIAIPLIPKYFIGVLSIHQQVNR